LLTDKEFYTELQSRTYDAIRSFIGKTVNGDLKTAMVAKIQLNLLEYAKELTTQGEFFYSDLIIEVASTDKTIREQIDLGIQGKL
jgi:hypothetical protein